MKINNQSFLFYLSIAIVLLATLSPVNGNMAGNKLDKIVHWGIFFFLTVQFLRYTNFSKKQTEGLLWIMVSGLLIEILQQWIPGRGMDIYDGLADVLGVVCGYYFDRFRQG